MNKTKEINMNKTKEINVNEIENINMNNSNVVDLFDEKYEEVKINDKLTVVYDNKQEKENYNAFVYKICISYIGKDEIQKFYVGWHKGTINDVYSQKYICSSDEVIKILAREDVKITYKILDFCRSSKDACTLEHRYLKEVDAKHNPEYFNKSNGGGKNLVPSKNLNQCQNNLQHIQNMMNNIKHNKYSLKFYKTQQLVDMKHIQVRREQYVKEHVAKLRDLFTAISNPKNIDPIHILMPKDPKDDNTAPIIINGNHSVAAVKKIKTHDGLYAIEIPHSDWHMLSDSELQSFGMNLNPQPEKVREPTSYDDAANWVVNYIKEFNLYKNDCPIYNHPLIQNHLNILGFTSAASKGEITKRAKKIHEENAQLALGVNILDFSDDGLKANDDLYRFFEKAKKHREDTFGETVFKVSAGDDIFKQITKTLFKYDESGSVIGWPKKIYVYIYFPNPGIEKSISWRKNYANFCTIINRLLDPEAITINYERLSCLSTAYPGLGIPLQRSAETTVNAISDDNVSDGFR